MPRTLCISLLAGFDDLSGRRNTLMAADFSFMRIGQR